MNHTQDTVNRLHTRSKNDDNMCVQCTCIGEKHPQFTHPITYTCEWVRGICFRHTVSTSYSTYIIICQTGVWNSHLLLTQYKINRSPVRSISVKESHIITSNKNNSFPDFFKTLNINRWSHSHIIILLS